ncbi:MAG: adenylosuccinate synthase [Actinobacteria bacterium]|nr:adenylosuccinate synthase [Actinomycetota bacterium]MCL6087480.1 adenylosuccinate synthase [Actinomycetota bacterium]
MSNIVLIGAQWGDEGKGRITDFLSSKVNMVVRFQGGDNAGHTVIFKGLEFKLHLIPSGILYPDVICVIGNGVVINPQTLISEIENLEKKAVSTENLKISSNCHVIMPYHIALDGASENKLGSSKIGTTKKGIGPVYADKASRTGIRICDLLNPDLFKQKLDDILEIKNAILNKVYDAETFNADKIFEEYTGYAQAIKKYVVESTFLINSALDDNKNILFEGAQGTLLDIDHGTYPFVTSSSTIAGGVFTGAGIGPGRINEVIGITKSYCTRVGSGVFPTEIKDETGNMIREKGNEYGTTTGRARRCGWFDCVIIRYSAMVNNLSSLALTKLDVLSGIEKIKICSSYKIDGSIYENVTPNCLILEKSQPQYIEVNGWDEDITNIKEFEKLPYNAKKYINLIEELTRIPVSLISVGPDRNQIIIRDKYLKKKFF